jgi:hypothetical protein
MNTIESDGKQLKTIAFHRFFDLMAQNLNCIILIQLLNKIDSCKPFFVIHLKNQ